MKTNCILIELPLFPSIEFWSLILKFDHVIFEKHEHFQKQTHRNRYYIKDSNDIQCLQIPIEKSFKKSPITDVKITDFRWTAKHRHAIETAYQSAPYFPYYSDDLWAIFQKKHPTLWVLNFDVFCYLMDNLNIKIHYSFTDTYEKAPTGVHDYRHTLNKSLDHQHRQLVTFKKYTQLFQQDFISNLSCLDLLLNIGVESVNLLE